MKHGLHLIRSCRHLCQRLDWIAEHACVNNGFDVGLPVLCVDAENLLRLERVADPLTRLFFAAPLLPGSSQDQEARGHPVGSEREPREMRC